MIDDQEVKDYASEMDSIMNVVENELYQTKNKSRQDPLNFPIKLTNKLAGLNSLSQMRTSDFPPTVAAYAVRDEMVAKVDAQLDEFTKVKETMVPQLNKMIRDKALDVIVLKKE